MSIKLKNNAVGFLATTINASDTGLVLQTGTGANFPTLGARDYFYATIESTGGTTEVVKVTARSGDAMTVVRAQEGTAANSFAAGSRVELRVTAQSVYDVSRYDQTVSLSDFGAVGNGTTDDTAAIQAAINFCSSLGDSGLKCITAPSNKSYRITNTLTIDTNRLTLDLNKSELLLDDASGLKSHVLIGNGTTQRGGVRLRNITFTRQQAATAGYAIDTNRIGVCEFTDCRIYGNNEIYSGIRIRGGIICLLQNLYIDNCVDTGIYLEGIGAGADRTIDITIRECRAEGGRYGLATWNYVEGLFCRDNIFFNHSVANAVLNASSAATGLASFKLQENDFDTSTGVGLYVDNVTNLQITDCWFSNISGTALEIKEGVDGVVIADNQFYPSAGGMTLYGQGAIVTGNLMSGGATSVDIKSSSSDVALIGNIVSNAQIGITIGAGATRAFVSNNDIFGMSVGAINNLGVTGAHIENNRGDSARGKTSYITVGASPFTYTTGPRPETVSVTAGNVTSIYIDGKVMSGAFLTTVGYTLPPNTSMVVTYTAVPIMTKLFL